MTEPLSPRRRLHHSIRSEFSVAASRYFRAHPEQLLDPAFQHYGEDIQAMLFKLVEEISRIVDEYEIDNLPPKD